MHVMVPRECDVIGVLRREDQEVKVHILRFGIAGASPSGGGITPLAS